MHLSRNRSGTRSGPARTTARSVARTSTRSPRRPGRDRRDGTSRTGSRIRAMAFSASATSAAVICSKSRVRSASRSDHARMASTSSRLPGVTSAGVRSPRSASASRRLGGETSIGGASGREKRRSDPSGASSGARQKSSKASRKRARSSARETSAAWSAQKKSSRRASPTSAAAPTASSTRSGPIGRPAARRVRANCMTRAAIWPAPVNCRAPRSPRRGALPPRPRGCGRRRPGT